MVRQEKTTIGRTALASFPLEGIRGVPVKIDTGADSSSIWASEIYIDDDYILHFVLFAKGSPYYSGTKHSTKVYEVRRIRSSNGTQQIRYSVKLTTVLGGRKIRASFTLSDRSQNTYPVLIGNKLLNRKFLVDVSRGTIRSEEHAATSMDVNCTLNEELVRDPKAFFEKYHLENQRGDIAP